MVLGSGSGMTRMHRPSTFNHWVECRHTLFNRGSTPSSGRLPTPRDERSSNGYRNLPMGRHDAQKMSSLENRAALERFVRIEHALLSQLTDAVHEHEGLLAQTP